MKAVWEMDYDYRTDKTYSRPSCPECGDPIGKQDDGYRCFSCGELVSVEDPDMIQWFMDRSVEKVEIEDCPRLELFGTVYGCGGEKCVETHYTRNKITLEWQAAWGECKNCGRKFIV